MKFGFSGFLYFMLHLCLHNAHATTTYITPHASSNDVRITHSGEISPCKSNETCYDVTTESVHATLVPTWYIGDPRSSGSIHPNPTCVNLVTTDLWVQIKDATGCTDQKKITKGLSFIDGGLDFFYTPFCSFNAGGPTINGERGGEFAFDPLPSDNATIDAQSGIIETSTAGATYTVKYTVTLSCGVITDSRNVTIPVGPNISDVRQDCDPNTKLVTASFSTDNNVILNVFPQQYNRANLIDGRWVLTDLPPNIEITIFGNSGSTSCGTTQIFTTKECICSAINPPTPSQTEYNYCGITNPVIPTISAMADDPNAMLHWYDMPMSMTPLASNSNTYQPTTPGTYYVEAEYPDGCGISDRLGISVNEFLLDTISTRFICNPNNLYDAIITVTPSVTLTSNSISYSVVTSGNDEYTIEDIPLGTVLSLQLDLSSIANCSKEVSISTPLTDCNQCVTPLPPSITSGSVLPYCEGGTIPLLTAITRNGLTANWYTINATGDTVLVAASNELQPTEANTYYVDQGVPGCQSKKAKVEVFSTGNLELISFNRDCNMDRSYNLDVSVDMAIILSNDLLLGSMADDGNGNYRIENIPEGVDFAYSLSDANSSCTKTDVITAPSCMGCISGSMSIDTSVCQGSSLSIRGVDITDAQQVIVDSSNGCDSTFTVLTTFFDAYEYNVALPLCIGSDTIIGSTSYNESNPVGTETLVSSEGCDSIIHIDLTFLSTPFTVIDTLLCMGSSITVGSTIFDESNLSGMVTIPSASAGCSSEVSVTVQYIPENIIQIDTTICEGEMINTDIGMVSDIGTYRKTIGIGSNGCDSIIEYNLDMFAVSVVVEEPSRYCKGDEVLINGVMYTNSTTVMDTLKNANNCDSLIIEMPMTFVELDISIEEQVEIFPGQMVSLTPEFNFEPVDFSWSPSASLSCNNCLQPDANPYTSLTYTLKAKDENGCEMSTDVEVEVIESEIVYFPNLFSSSSDQLENQKFALKFAEGITGNYDMNIFDRWGTVIYSIKNADILDSDAFWDGKMSDRILIPGVYVYDVVLRLDGFAMDQYSGTVTVID